MSYVSDNLAIYVHWPYCLAKCPYCDFNSHVRKKSDEENMRRALLSEIDYYADKIGNRNITSIFFGGGTPSLMSGKTLGALLDKLDRHFSFSSGIEISLEANPTSVEAAKFEDFAAAGVNRLSLGIQALNDKDLKALGREHSVEEAMGAIALAQKYFSRSSFDLIYARMGQNLSDWEGELKQALNMAVAGHLSLYQLTIEPDTAFYNAHRRGKLILPDEELSAEIYDLTNDICADAGLPSYEVSNYAKAGEESRHNLTYWQYGDYLGIGAGAHSRMTYEGQTYASSQFKKPEKYIMAVDSQSHASEFHDLLDAQMMAEEMIMMSLRLRRGLSYKDFKSRIGQNLENFINKEVLEALEKDGYLIQSSQSLKLSEKGVPLLNHILGKILV